MDVEAPEDVVTKVTKGEEAEEATLPVDSAEYHVEKSTSPSEAVDASKVFSARSGSASPTPNERLRFHFTIKR